MPKLTPDPAHLFCTACDPPRRLTAGDRALGNCGYCKAPIGYAPDPTTPIAQPTPPGELRNLTIEGPWLDGDGRECFHLKNDIGTVVATTRRGRRVAETLAAAPELRDVLARIVAWIAADCDPSRQSLESARVLLARLGVTL